MAEFLLLDSSYSIPGKYSIPILISTLSLIALGDSTSRYNVLNWKIFRFLGRSSYTIYLVHWPLVVLTSVYSVSNNSSILKDITLFVLSIFLESIIFKFYENSKGWDRCDALLPQNRNALIAGDSNAVDALTLLHNFLPADNFAVSTLGACPPTNIMKSLVSATHPKLETCIEINKKWDNVNYLKKFDYIAIDVLFHWYSPTELIRYIERDVNTSGYVDLKNHMKELGYYFIEPKVSRNSPLDCPLWKDHRELFSWDNQHVSYEFVFELFSDYRAEVVRYLGYASEL